MPRNGSGVASKPPNTTAQPNTTIRSAMFNSVIDDLYQMANEPLPETAGGTGASNIADARTKLELDRKTVYSVKTAAYTAVADDNNGYFRYTTAATLAFAAAATLGSNWHLTVHAYGVAVVLDPNGSELINGATTATIPPGSIATIICDGGAFWARIDQEPAYSAKSAAYTAVLTDDENTLRFTAAATLSLTAAATLGSGWRIWVENSSAGNVVVDPNASQLINGALTLTIGPGRMAYIFCDGAAFWADIVDPLQGPQNQGFSYGLSLSTNATDAANDIDIGIGSAAADTSPYYLMELLAARTKRIDAAWAVGNNAGGLDTGTVQVSNTYYIWLIQRSDTLVTDALFSLSATAPTMPANYDRKRLIGSFIRSSSINGSPTLVGQQQSDVKVWVNFNGTGTVAIRASRNVSSITDNGTGNYTVNFTTALADANYAPLISVAGAAPNRTGNIRGDASNVANNKTTTALSIQTGFGGDGTFVDLPEIYVAILR